MDENLSELSDLELLVAWSQAKVDTFGYGSYKHEYKAEQARNAARLDVLRAEAKARGLLEANGFISAKGTATGFEADPRVVAKRADNQAYFAARFGGRGHHTSPYGERYGR